MNPGCGKRKLQGEVCLRETIENSILIYCREKICKREEDKEMKFPEIPLFVYLVVLLLLLLWGVKRAPKGKFFDNFLDLDITKGLQGLTAVAIMLHHLTQKVTNYGQIDKGAIAIMNDVGVLLTGIFFFFSGYGLYTSFKNKENYLDGFLKKRLPVVLIPFYMTNTIFLLISLLLRYKMTVGEFFLYLSGFVLLNSQMWYIVEIIILYLAFYIIFRFIKKQKVAFPVMALFILVMTVVTLLRGHDKTYASGGAWFKGEWWYNSTWTFFIGMLIARYKEPVVLFAKKHYKKLLSAGIALFVVMHLATIYMLGHVGYWKEWEGYPGYTEKFLTWSVQGPTVIVFVLVFLLLTLKVQFHNPIIKFLGKIAIELYLIHNIFILYLPYVVKNDFLYFLCVYAGGILLAVGIHFVDQRLIKKICRK